MVSEAGTVSNLGELLGWLKADLTPEKTSWFRGHSKAEWKLLPSLAREPIRLDREQDLIARFQQNASLLLTHFPKTEWEWLTIMQHHGVPTRLLDWTESPLVGLYFAVEANPEEDGALWILCPTELNIIAGIKPDLTQYIPSFEDPTLNNYLPTVLASETRSRLNPVAVIGRRNTPRMQAQLGVHTVVHRDAIALEEMATNNHVKKYLIPAAAKQDITNELSMLAFGKFQLFPELQTLGEILKRL